ncbi:MAG: 30S ribosomal protein S18 [Patescibacteria group bacterium]
MRQSQQKPTVPRACHFCVNGLEEVDYKDIKLLQRFVSSYAKILPKKKTGVCSRHQRMLSESIKRARFTALLPFTTR